MMLLVTPPFAVPDEGAHYFRTCQIASGDLVSEVRDNRIGSELPLGNHQFLAQFHTFSSTDRKRESEEFKEAFHKKPDSNQKLYANFPNTSLYSPLVYLPQSLGMNLGKLFNASYLLQFYLARLFALLFFLFMGYQALRTVPGYKLLYLFLLLLPMPLFIAASLSADTVANALCLFTIAYALKLIFDKETVITEKQIFFIFLLSSLVTIAKTVYFPILLLGVLIPLKRFRQPFYYWLSLSGVILLVVLFSWLAQYQNRQLTDQVQPIEHIFGSDSGTPGINPDKQLAQIISDPVAFLQLTANSFYHLKDFVVKTWIGVFGWLNISLSNYFYLLTALLIGFLLIADQPGSISLQWKHRFIMLLSFLAVVLTFSVVMYSYWNEPGDLMIGNLQGRYFIPAVPLLLLTISSHRIKIAPSWLIGGSVLFILGSLIYSGISIWLAYS
jgi:uncharacterized membrane protein